MIKNLVTERIENVERHLDEMERIISDDMTDKEYDSNRNIQRIHKEIIGALNQLRRDNNERA